MTNHWNRFAHCVVCLVGIIGSVGGQEDSRSPRDWTVSRKHLRQPDQVKSDGAGSLRQRLMLELPEPTVSRGDTLRLLCGVGLIGHGDLLVNPFTTATFPKNIALAVYDENAQFLASLPSEDKRPPDVDDAHLVKLKFYELRGKWVEVRIGSQPSATSDFVLPLSPGDYQIQMIACERFFLGDGIAYFEQKKDPNDAYRIDPRNEAARSNIVRFRVTNTPPSPPVADPDPNEPPKLLTSFDFKEYPGSLQDVEACRFTLTNQSYSRFIGLIDPFHPDSKPFELPVRWTRRERGRTFTNGGEAYNRWDWRPQRSEFVILPPRGVVSNMVGVVTSRRGEDQIRVDPLKGIVIDEWKLDVLRSGNPTKGWFIGGVSPDTLDPKSELQRNLTFMKF